MKKLIPIILAVAMVAGVPLGALMMFVVFLGNAAQAAQTCAPAQPDGTVLVVDSGGPVRLPVVGRFKVMSEFNPGRVDPVDGKVRFHKGLDLAEIPAGGDVVAMKAGTVTRTYVEPWGANTVEIDHGGGITSRYLHLARWTVKPGQQVAVGQQIGIEGSTGHSTGPHVHWEVRVTGQLVNPREWAKAQGINVPPKGGEGTAPGATKGQGPPSASAPTVVPAAEPGPASSSGATAGPVPNQVGIWTKPQLELALQIISAGEAKGLDDWTITVGVMTSMKESSLTNVDHGDAVRGDTKWSFQQGPEWGPASVRSVPYGAAGLFFAALVKVPNYHSLAPTIAAHQTQHNADPYTYAPFWDDAVQVLAALKGAKRASALGADPYAASCDPATTPTPTSTPTTRRPTTPPVAVLKTPAAPAVACPTRGTLAEQLLPPSALNLMRCTAKAFPTQAVQTATPNTPIVRLPIANFRTSVGRSNGWVTANWIQQYASRLGATTVIYDGRIWTKTQTTAGWRPYQPAGGLTDDTIARRDHIEVRTA